MKRVVSIAVLTPRSKSMLWMRRADNQKWTLPGGHIEEGESPVDGALRELWEETGIRASKKDLKALGYDNVDDKYRVYAFTYTPDSIPVPTSENDPDEESDGEFLWFKDGELPEKQHVPEAKNVTLNLLKDDKKLNKSDETQSNVLNLPLDRLVVNRQSLFDAFDNVGHRSGTRGSKTPGPVSVWLTEEGEHLLVDGHHRLAHHLLSGSHGGSIPVQVTGSGYSDYWHIPKGIERAVLDPKLKYGGLEDLADDAILESDHGRVFKKMAIKDLPPGERVDPEEQMQTWGDTFDYSHLLPSKWKGKLALHVHQGNEMSLARLYDLEDPDHNHIGEVKAFHGEQLPWEERAIEPHSKLHEDYQGLGLGQAMYEAMYAHAYHNMGIRQVVGSFHTDAAGRVHEKLAAKHGLGYKKQSPRPTVEGNDAVRKPYKYTLKTELHKSENDEISPERQAYNDYVDRRKQSVIQKLRGIDGASEVLQQIDTQPALLPAYITPNRHLFDDELIKDLYLLTAHANAYPGWANVWSHMRPSDRLEVAKHVYGPESRSGFFSHLLHNETDPQVYRGLLEHAKSMYGQSKITSFDMGSLMNSALHNKVATHTDLHEAVTHPPLTNVLSGDHLEKWVNHPKTPNESKIPVLNSLYSNNNKYKLVMARGVPIEYTRSLLGQMKYWEKLHPELTTDDIRHLVGHKHPGMLNDEQQQALAMHFSTPDDIIHDILKTDSDEEYDPDTHLDWAYYDSPYQGHIDDLESAIFKKDTEGLAHQMQSLNRSTLRLFHYRLADKIRNLDDPSEERLNDENYVSEVHDLADELLEHFNSLEADNRDEYQREYERTWEPTYKATDEQARELAALHPSISPEEANRRAAQAVSDNEWSPWLLNPHVKDEILRASAKSSPGGFAHQVLAMRYPDEYNANKVYNLLHVPNVSTEKVRHLRDKIESLGGVTHHKNLGNLPPSIKPFLDKQGNLSARQLQQMVESVPHTPYWVGHPGYQWEGDQRHSNEPQDLFHVNYTDDHVRQLKEAGVWDTFVRIQPQIAFGNRDSRPHAGSGHPLGPTSIGWVRYNHGADGIHIDEVQSDIGQKRLNDMFLDYGMKFPPEHIEKIHQILWGSRKTAQDLLGEAFMHYLRQDPQNHGKAVHWPSHELKTKVADPPLDTYSRLPKELGFTPATYGELSVQDNKSHNNLPTMKSKVAKSEDDLIECVRW